MVEWLYYFQVLTSALGEFTMTYETRFIDCGKVCQCECENGMDPESPDFPYYGTVCDECCELREKGLNRRLFVIGKVNEEERK